MTDEQLAESAQKLAQGRLFCASQLPPESNLLGMVFMPLGLGGLGDIDPDTIGEIFEDLDKANERGVNGFPTFFSCTIVHRDDWAIIWERAHKAYMAMKAAVEGQ